MKPGRLGEVGVPLAVELGRTVKSLDAVAGIGEGSIIELDRLAGEYVDLYAAGELIAKGEIVVIDERFALRVTEMVDEEP